jgi:tRNA pseudouridine55 synthase
VCAFLLDADKTYRVTARLGTSTNTGDADGTEVATAEVPELTAEEWSAILQRFHGDSMQVPPMFSALKKDGKRLYELARKGETVEREPRPIRIDTINLLEIAGNRLIFRVRCSKGTYIRVLVEDIARTAGTVAHTARLHRETVAGFHAEDMLDLIGLEAAAAAGAEALRSRLLPPDTALEGLPAAELASEAVERFAAGQEVAAPLQGVCGLVRVYDPGHVFVGVGELSNDGRLAPRRIFRRGEKNP